MPTVQCIHFDLDSVLYMPDNFLEQALHRSVQAMVSMGLETSHEEALALLKNIRQGDANAPDHFDRLVEQVNNTYDPLVVAAGVETYWDSKKGSMRPAQNARRVLESLSANYPLTIISNGIPVKQAGKLIRIGLSEFFHDPTPAKGRAKNRFFASAHPKKQKPHPFLWDQARDRLGFTHEHSVMVGDRFWNDILGANRLGMTTVKINQGAHAWETKEEALARHSSMGHMFQESDEKLLELMAPDFTINDLSELLEIVTLLER